MDDRVRLLGSDGVEVSVLRATLRESATLWNALELDGAGGTEVCVPVPGVSSSLLRRAFDLASLDGDRVASAAGALSSRDLVSLAGALDFLNLPAALDAAVTELAARVRGLSPERIREDTGIRDDRTVEEKAERAAEEAWLAGVRDA